jgi:hypothetical protein
MLPVSTCTGESSTSQSPAPEWDSQALRDIIATGYTEAVVLTDRNAKILHSELRRDVPEPLGLLLETALASYAATGHRFGLGELRIAASLHERGTLVCGRTDQHSLIILGSEKSNLGQLLSHVRRVFPRKVLP